MQSLINIFVLCIAFVFPAAGAGANLSPCSEHSCVGVVDAGSSGSRLYVYAFDKDAHGNPSNIQDVWSKKVKPGFAMLEPTEEAVSAYLKNLFENAPSDHIPVYFYATAGMRLVSYPKQQLLYSQLRQWFATQMQWQLIDAKTITGSEEGLLGWLAVNYRQGSLDAAEKPLVGVMDMGGASVQVSFPVESADKIDPQDRIEFDIYSRHVVLFVHSFLGLGQNAMLPHFLDSELCFPNEYPLPKGSPAAGDASSCRKEVSQLVNRVHAVHDKIAPIIAENPTGSWYVMGGLTAMAIDKPFQFEENQLTLEHLLQQADSAICHLSWGELEAAFPHNDYLYNYCLAASYYYALIVDGYGLEPSLPVHYVPEDKGMNWTLGVVLRQH